MSGKGPKCKGQHHVSRAGYIGESGIIWIQSINMGAISGPVRLDRYSSKYLFSPGYSPLTTLYIGVGDTQVHSLHSYAYFTFSYTEHTHHPSGHQMVRRLISPVPITEQNQLWETSNKIVHI